MSHKFKVAHIHEQGNDMVIIPLESSFGNQTHTGQTETIAALQACASSAGLAGTVVPVWMSGRSMNFIAPAQWHPFFRSISWNFVMANINKELTCG